MIRDHRKIHGILENLVKVIPPCYPLLSKGPLDTEAIERENIDDIGKTGREAHQLEDIADLRC